MYRQWGMVVLAVAACLIPGAAPASSAVQLDIGLESLDLPVGGAHLLVARVHAAGAPVAGRAVSFAFEDGPNASEGTRDCLTDTSGRCSVTVRSETAGTDLVRARADGAVATARLRWHPAVLDAGPERFAVAGGGQARVRVVVRSATDPSILLHARVDLEVVSGPNDNLRYGEADATCLVAGAPCTFSYLGQHTEGTDVIRAWIDLDLRHSVPGEADLGEGVDEAVMPGNVPEGDGTDVVERIWSELAPAGDLDCPGSDEQLGNRIVGTPGDDTLVGTANGDVICGLGGHDTIVGGAGNDAILAGHGSATIDGGEGFDYVTYHTSPGPVHADMASGTVVGDFGLDDLQGIEAVVGSFFDDVLVGGPGPDSFNGSYGDDLIIGGAGDDILYDFAGDDVLVGGSGDDLLIAQGGDDLLSGGDGDDRLFGGKGDDRLRGGPGTDRCVDVGGDDRFRGCEAILDRGQGSRFGGIDTGRWGPLYFPVT